MLTFAGGYALVLEHAGIEQRCSAAGDHAFLDRGLGRRYGVFNPVLLLL
jgi:hypothetical protein